MTPYEASWSRTLAHQVEEHREGARRVEIVVEGGVDRRARVAHASEVSVRVVPLDEPVEPVERPRGAREGVVCELHR
jgi:hypothetical protein